MVPRGWAGFRPDPVESSHTRSCIYTVWVDMLERFLYDAQVRISRALG